MKMQPVPVIPCREETTARVDVLRRRLHASRWSDDARPAAPRTRTRANACVAREGYRKLSSRFAASLPIRLAKFVGRGVSFART